MDQNYHWSKIKIYFLTGKPLLRKSWKQIYQTDCEGWKGHLRATWPLERLSFWYASALHFFSTLVLRFLVGCLVIVQELEVSIIKVQEFWEDHNFLKVFLFYLTLEIKPFGLEFENSRCLFTEFATLKSSQTDADEDENHRRRR